MGVTRSFLSLANLDRMAKRMPNDETFKQLPVIDGDHLLWVSNLFLPRFSVKTNDECMSSVFLQLAVVGFFFVLYLLVYSDSISDLVSLN